MSTNKQSQEGPRLSLPKPDLTVGLAVLLVGVLAAVTIPAIGQPHSRLYGGSVGYPALMRLLGRPISVETASARYEDMTELVSASGFTGYLNEIPINTEITGVVTQVYVKPGDRVKAGQILMRMDAGGAFSRRAESGGGLSSSRTSDIEILSPLSGVVIAVNVIAEENIIEPRDRLIIVGNRPVFRAAVDQRYFGKIKLGDEAEVRLQAFPGRTFAGKVVKLDNRVSTAGSRDPGAQPPFTFMPWLELEGAASEFAHGMNGYALFRYPSRVLALPESALMRFSGGEALVMRVDLDSGRRRAKIVPVAYTMSDAGRVAVSGGLREGDLVVASGQSSLKEGDLLRP